MQADGRIVVGGYGVNGGTGDIAAIQLNADGTLDNSFGTSLGTVFVPVVAADETVTDLVLQADGRIVLVGQPIIGVTPDFQVVRLTADGRPDPGFGDGSRASNSLAGTPIFTEGTYGSGTLLAPTAQIVDADLIALNSYAGTTLTLARSGGASSADRFEGMGFTYGGQVVDNVYGTIIGSHNWSAGTDTITFNANANANATQAQVTALLQGIRYRNVSDAPEASVQIDWTFSDGNAGAQGGGGVQQVAGQTTVAITRVNDAPSFGSGGNGIALTTFPARALAVPAATPSPGRPTVPSAPN